MLNVSIFGSRGLIALTLASGLVLMAASDSAGDQKSTTGPAQKSTSAAKQKSTQDHAPRLHAALRELKEARREVRESAPGHNYGGHKEHALQAIDHAIVQIELLIEHHPNNTAKKGARG